MMGDLTTHRVSNTALALMVVYWQHMVYPRLRVRSVKTHRTRLTHLGLQK